MTRRVPSGGYSVTVEFCGEVSRECIEKIHRVYYSLLKKLHKGFEVVVGLTALTIYYDPRSIKHSDLNRVVDEAIEESGDLKVVRKPREWTIPVLYGGEYGLDTDSVVKHTGLPFEEVVRLHSGGRYLCYTIGFTPGFLYLGEVDDRIAVPRLETPRLRVSAGSVGIAGKLTGVYSVDSPGGWRIIGRTPLKLIDFTRSEPMLIKPGDTVVFKPISKEEFSRLEGVFIGEYHG